MRGQQIAFIPLLPILPFCWDSVINASSSNKLCEAHAPKMCTVFTVGTEWGWKPWGDSELVMRWPSVDKWVPLWSPGIWSRLHPTELRERAHIQAWLRRGRGHLLGEIMACSLKMNGLMRTTQEITNVISLTWNVVSWMKRDIMVFTLLQLKANLINMLASRMSTAHVVCIQNWFLAKASFLI